VDEFIFLSLLSHICISLSEKVNNVNILSLPLFANSTELLLLMLLLLRQHTLKMSQHQFLIPPPSRTFLGFAPQQRQQPQPQQ
jgi:hypothetical protein